MTNTTDSSRIVLDQSACIREQSNIGETVTHNICSGAKAVVPWGSADWLGFLALVMFVLVMVSLIGWLIWMMARDR